MKKIIICLLLVLVVTLFISGCSDADVKTSNGLQKGITGSAVIIDYNETKNTSWMSY